MSDTFILAPSANPITVSATFSEEERAYVQQWFSDVKQAGETIEPFLKRLLISAALNHRKRRVYEQIQGEKEAAIEPIDDAAGNARSTLQIDFLATLSTLLGE